MANVLVVDDDSHYRGIIERIILRSDTYSVKSVASEVEAWDELSRNPYDLVLLDLYIDGKKSWETLKRINMLPSAPVVIMISCEELAENAEYAKALGAADFIPKPIDFARLKSSVDAALKRRREAGLVCRAGDAADADEDGETLGLLIFADRESRVDTVGALSSSRFRLFETADPGWAADTVRKERLDAVLARMDKDAGPAAEFLAALRGEEPGRLRVPVIAVTDADPDRILAALKAGADDYVALPFDPRIIAAKVRAHVRYRREHERKLKDGTAGAVTDAVTGAYTKAYLKDRLHEEFRRSSRYRRNLSLGLLTLNDLEGFRARWGSDTVGRIMSEISRLLRSTLRRSDIIGHHGEHEFAMIFPETTATGITRRAGMIRASVEDRVANVVDRSREVACSIGLATLQDPSREDTASERAATAEELLGMASAALSRALEDGKGRIQVFRRG